MFAEHTADLISRLLAINGLSLAFALISNSSLLLNMAQRISFSIAQPITIVGWYIASFLLIGDISGIIHIVKVPDERRALTQGYYYAIFAAAIYFLIATLMVITVYGAWKGHYSKEFKLTMSQRTLMLQTISFMVYMVGGAGIYAKIEGWMFLDGLYFTNYTLLTVGIGDYVPQTDLGRGLLFPYAIGGIVILGLVIGSIRSLVLERGREKLGARMTEKQRQAMLKKMMKAGDELKLKPVETNEQEKELGMNEQERRREEFNIMRKIQEQAATKQKWMALLIALSAWVFLWFIGALIFHFTEHEQAWSYFEALYFSYTTLLTIGYGDYKPFSNSGKAFFVFWSLLAVPTLTIVVSNMGDTIVKAIRDATHYLGEITVLPGEAPMLTRMKQAAHILTGGKLPKFDPNNQDSSIEVEPPGILGDAPRHHDEEKQHYDPTSDAAASKVEADELHATRSAENRGDDLDANIHRHHYLLVKEFRNVMKHLNDSPPRRYTYEEWAWFLKLMGEDEASVSSHRAPPVDVSAREGEAADPAKVDKGHEAGIQSGGGKGGVWSWLGERSPLMGEMEEAEWVLERLVGVLEGKLRRLSEEKRKEGMSAAGGGGAGALGKGSSSGGSGETLKGKGVSLDDGGVGQGA